MTYIVSPGRRGQSGGTRDQFWIIMTGPRLHSVSVTGVLLIGFSELLSQPG